MAPLLALALTAILTSPVRADELRLAVWNIELERQGPGLLLADISQGKDPQINAAIDIINALDADVWLLTGFDYDYGLSAAQLFNQNLAQPFPHLFAAPPNRGRLLNVDLNGDGKIRQPHDTQSFGAFWGQAGMLVLSKLPILPHQFRDFSDFLWRDLPMPLLPESLPLTARAQLRLASSGFWDLPLELSDGQILRLLTYHASPPAFEGEDARNSRRNHDETAFWLRLLRGDLPFAAPAPPFVLLGTSNLDPQKGAGFRDIIHELHNDPAVQSLHPSTLFEGKENHDTVVFEKIGGLRSEIVLPSLGLKIKAAGIFRPAAVEPLFPASQLASRHFPVWIDLEIP